MPESQILDEEVIAMAIAAIAEEEGTDISRVRVVSFRELKKSSLQQYIAEHHIQYHKYQLGEEQ